MKSEMCLSCAHTKVCFKDKNVVGDVFVAGNPMIFDNTELFRKYEARKAVGFPCDDYMAIGKPDTNASRIRAMTDEELAMEICSWMKACGDCPGASLCTPGDGGANGMRKWLKQEAEENAT